MGEGDFWGNYLIIIKPLVHTLLPIFDLGQLEFCYLLEKPFYKSVVGLNDEGCFYEVSGLFYYFQVIYGKDPHVRDF